MTAEPSVHLAIAGVFLTDLKGEDAGNLAVWPGSHRALSAHFRRHGIVAERHGLPALDELGVEGPLQLRPRAGDAVIMHGLLAHAAVANASSDDRLAIYFRTWPRAASGMPSLRERLADANAGWLFSQFASNSELRRGELT